MKQISKFGNNHLMPHFIYATNHYTYSNKVERMFLKNMRTYGIQSSVLTVIGMERLHLITKEKQKQAYNGKLKNDQAWKYYKGSINDEIESFYDNLQNQEVRSELVRSFFTPKLTKEELKLVARKNKEHLRTYLYNEHADVDEEEMKKSNSKDKYVHCECWRNTVLLALEPKNCLCKIFGRMYDWLRHL